MFFQNVSEFLSDYMVPHPRKHYPSFSVNVQHALKCAEYENFFFHFILHVLCESFCYLVNIYYKNMNCYGLTFNVLNVKL